MAPAEHLRYVQLNASHVPETLLNLNDGVNYFIKATSFKILPPTKQQIISQDQRRWGGGRQVAEITENGAIEWECAVAGATEQEVLVKTEVMLSQVEANPYPLYVEWKPPGAAQPTLYEVRGTATWTPNYEVSQFEGANLFIFTVHIPVGPLAQGLPLTVYEKSGITLPETLTLGTVPGDAPAKAEVSVTTGTSAEESFITGAHLPTAVAANGAHLYWANEETGYIGRSALAGTTVEETWLHVEGTPSGVAVDATYVYWAASGSIGRAQLNGTSVEKSWITGAGSPEGIALNAEHIYWSNGLHVGRAKLAGTEVTPTWLATGGGTGGVAVDATYLYWTESKRIGGIGRATLEGAAKEEGWLTGVGYPGSVVVTSAFVYWGNQELAASTIGRANITGGEVIENWVPLVHRPYGLAAEGTHVFWAASTDIGRASTEYSPPIFALLGWAAKPASGLATAPFGLLDSSEATAEQGWAYGSVSGARGGKALHGSVAIGSAYWEVDPATMTPDSFQGEIAVEVWARVLVSSGLSSPLLTLSAQPQDGTGYGAPRYTDEWGSGGRPVTLPSSGETFRMTRLGTLHLLVNPLAPRIWKLWLEATSAVTAEWIGIDYLLLCPSTQRACSPSGKPNNTAYPRFIANTAPTTKTVLPNLSALIRKPSREYGHPDHGLGGELLQVPAGEADMLIKLSSLVPDSPETNASSEQLSYEATVKVTVTPRFFLTRTS